MTDAAGLTALVTISIGAVKDVPQSPAALEATDAVGVVDLGWSQFVVVRFAPGYSLNNVSLAIDGVEVSSAFTPVTDDGSIVKWELEYLNPGTLTATEKTTGARKTVEINKAADAIYDGSRQPTPGGRKNTSPGYMIAHGPVAVWDYYLTNYAADGSIRVEPAKTVFYNGSYTMTVHSHGFKDMSISFTVVGGENPPVRSAAWKSWEKEVDAVSSATYSGSTGSGDGSGGGGQQLSADLKFNADLLINALILERIGIRLDAAARIVERWESEMAGWDSVSGAETTLGGFAWSDYIDAVSRERREGEYLCFADYAQDAADLEKADIPHAVKSVLEDNMLGDIQPTIWSGT